MDSEGTNSNPETTTTSLAMLDWIDLRLLSTRSSSSCIAANKPSLTVSKIQKINLSVSFDSKSITKLRRESDRIETNLEIETLLPSGGDLEIEV